MTSSPFRRLLALRIGAFTGAPICLARPIAISRPHLLPAVTLSLQLHHPRFISLKPQRFPRDGEIIQANHLTAIFIDHEQVYHGLVHVPLLLSSIDLSIYHLVLINPGDGTEDNPPIIRQYTHEGLNLYEQQQTEKAKEQHQKRKEQKAASLTKEYQFTWAISKHDLGIKLRKAGEMLAKKMRVEIVIKGKRGMAKVTRAEAEELVRIIEETLMEKGGEEWKEREGDIGTMMTMSYQPLGKGKKGPVKKEDLVEGGGEVGGEALVEGRGEEGEEIWKRVEPEEQVSQSNQEYPPPTLPSAGWEGPR
ncbi:hypothetical protein BGX38DRAFT_1211934 [Terfezia claveryi]|nr:hypothetical protein BGX38DRAFT_1240760 [Terfezia claveryi]KAF8437343.1 hypothetical protein BGX38DRAFT_1211934 [Terfezia claveryi]